MPHPLRWTLAAAAAALLAIAVPARGDAQGATPPGAPAAAAAPRDPVKADLLRQLLARSKAADQAISMMEASIPAQRAANPRIPPVFWDRFLAQASAQRGELADMIADVYDRHFTTAELRQLLAFYDTPIGAKLLATMPAISQESMAAGQEWGRKIGMAVGAQLAAEGVVAP